MYFHTVLFLYSVSSAMIVPATTLQLSENLRLVSPKGVLSPSLAAAPLQRNIPSRTNVIAKATIGRNEPIGRHEPIGTNGEPLLIPRLFLHPDVASKPGAVNYFKTVEDDVYKAHRGVREASRQVANAKLNAAVQNVNLEMLQGKAAAQGMVVDPANELEQIGKIQAAKTHLEQSKALHLQKEKEFLKAKKELEKVGVPIWEMPMKSEELERKKALLERTFTIGRPNPAPKLPPKNGKSSSWWSWPFKKE